MWEFFGEAAKGDTQPFTAVERGDQGQGEDLIKL